MDQGTGTIGDILGYIKNHNEEISIKSDIALNLYDFYSLLIESLFSIIYLKSLTV